MADVVFDPDATREAGSASSVYDTGRNGKVVVLALSGVTANLVCNVGFGYSFVAWENPSDSVANPVGPFRNGVTTSDRIVLQTSSTRFGNLWVFYKNGQGDARGSNGGATIFADNVNEVSRQLGRLRMVVFSCSSITDGQTSALGLKGIRHLLTRPNSTNTGQCCARFVTAADRSAGTVTWDVTSGTKQCRLICLVAAGMQ